MTPDRLEIVGVHVKQFRQNLSTKEWYLVKEWDIKDE